METRRYQLPAELERCLTRGAAYQPMGSSHCNSELDWRVREVVRCHVWLGQTKGAMIDGGSTVRRPCSALLPG